jgi:hypothetical protein
LKQFSNGLLEEFEAVKRNAEAAAEFIRGSNRFSLTAVGDVNTYAIFAEWFLRATSQRGRAGVIVPTGIATDDSTKGFFKYLIENGRLTSLHGFENEEFLFRGLHHAYRFCFLTLSGFARSGPTDFVFFARQVAQLVDARRHFTLSVGDLTLLNPNTRTCPIFRTGYDAELTKKIYRRVPILIDEAHGEAGNPWGISFMAMFHMANDSGLFRTHAELADAGGHLEGNVWTTSDGGRLLPLYEAKMIHHYDHRWASYNATGESDNVPPEQKCDRSFRALPRYWVEEATVEDRLCDKDWSRGWLMGWRDICRATDERTVVASIVPRAAAGDTLLLQFPSVEPALCACLAGCLDCLALDFVARQKVGGAHLKYVTFKQLAVLPPSAYATSERAFIIPRVLELTYTGGDMQAFAVDLGYEGEPFQWNPERRALLRAELDAYFAYLYGLTRDELRYILDPQELMGEHWPSETFRVLKEREIRDHGECRTRRLVLDAFDRFHADGTFDPARFSDPHYFETVKAALATSKTQLADAERQKKELELLYRGLVKRAADAKRPVLFVEGANDVPVVEAAWEVFCPGKPRPFAVLAAGGTPEMKALATRGKAMKQLLGDKLVFAFSDNDGAGRALWEDGHLHKGGKWRPQTNGVIWCLLAPTIEFKAAMQKAGVPEGSWPCLMENAFPASVRRQAMADGAYELKPEFFADLLDCPPFMKTLLKLQSEVPPDDDLWLYLKAPTVEAKDAFTAWITRPERRTPENYAAFKEIIEGLHTLLEKHASSDSTDARQARLI